MANVVDIIVLDDEEEEEEEGPSCRPEAKKSAARTSIPSPRQTEAKKSVAKTSTPTPRPTEAKKSVARTSTPTPRPTEAKKSAARTSTPSPQPIEVKDSPVKASPPNLPQIEAKKGAARTSTPSPQPIEVKNSPVRASSPNLPQTEAKKSPARASPPPSEPQGKAKKDTSQNKAALSSDNKKLFEVFVDYCSKLTSDNPEVITYLQGRFSKANPSYLSSVEFRNTLGRCLSRVQGKRTKVFVYINELCTVLKTHTAKKRLVLKPPSTPPASQDVEVKAGPSNEIPEADEEVPETSTASKRQIRYLENLLRLYAQEIQKLQEKELSLDDLADEDSTYIQESRLKRKLLRIFEKLCELKDCPSLTGRVIEQRIQYKGTRYPEINRRLEKFINKERDIFPDYGDVFQVVQRTDDKHSLGLTRKQMQSMAQDAFRELGNKLQDRRHLDMVYNFGCHLTDAYKNGNDPAIQDSSLTRRLRENRSTAINHLEDIIKKYAEMQDDGEDEGWKNKKGSELPSTSKDKKRSPRSRQASSSESEDDEESEESDVDIDEELKQSEQAVDGEDEEETVAEEVNEADQKMEEEEGAVASQNPSPAGKEGSEHEQSNDDGKDGDDPMEVGVDEEQESPLGSTSLSSEKESTNVSLESEADTMHSASLENSNDGPPSEAGECAEQPEDKTLCETSHETQTPIHTEEHPEVNGPTDDLTEKKETEVATVPYVEVDTPANKEQGARKCTDPKDDSLVDSKSPLIKKEVRSGRLDQCINRLSSNVTHKGASEKRTPAEKETPPPSPLTHEVNEKPCAEGTPNVKPEEQNSNGKLVCVDTLANSQDSVRKIAFSHSPPVDSSTDVLHLDADRESTHSNASNGVHRALVRPATPVNRLKLRKPINASTDAIKLIKLEKQSPSRKRKGSPQIWTNNGVNKCNGSENGEDQEEENVKRAKLDCSSASVSSPSEPGSDNEHDMAMDMMVACSPKPPSEKAPVPYTDKVDASTQCDPDEVIVLSD